ncbi:MAG: hypothetical protein R6U04_12280 [Bacteroidales bacterium]
MQVTCFTNGVKQATTGNTSTAYTQSSLLPPHGLTPLIISLSNLQIVFVSSDIQTFKTRYEKFRCRNSLIILWFSLVSRSFPVRGSFNEKDNEYGNEDGNDGVVTQSVRILTG